MAEFAEVLAGARSSAAGRILNIPATWLQGRTAYGGFSSALALAEAMRMGGDLPRLRSAQVAMMAPLAGEVEVSAVVMRRGRNATWVSAGISGDKGIGLTASFVFMSPLSSDLSLDERPAPKHLIPVEDAPDMATERGPAFLRNHFDLRLALPRGAKRKAEMCRWVRLRESDGLDPMVALLLVADGLPPGVMPLLAPSVPVSTMHWQVNVLSPAPATRDGWWLLRSVGDHARDGGASQRMAVWNAEGRPMLAGIQSIAVFG